MRFSVFFTFLLFSVFASAQRHNEAYEVDATNGSFAVEETIQKLDFKIYPNPMTGVYLNIDSRRSEVKNIIIFNVLGETVFEKETLENLIILQNLKTGIYLVKLIQGNHMGLKRLLIP
tara:strand:- start:149 stop:502 length:354 start_codon:yes stop_codon:yes gene_type:complete